MEERPGYLPELLAEKDSLDPSFVNCMRLLTRGKFRDQKSRSAFMKYAFLRDRDYHAETNYQLPPA